jgi:hypothetical protein
VVKIVQILEREILTGMRGLGAASVKDLKPEMASRFERCRSLLLTVLNRSSGLTGSPSRGRSYEELPVITDV